MKYTRRIVLITVLLVVPWSMTSAATDNTSQFDLLKSMSVADYRATGLDKLSDAQIKALSAWFAIYQSQHPMNCAKGAAQTSPKTAATIAAGIPAAAAGSVQKSGNSSDVITSRIRGTFTGWSGSTIFKLDNGQTWQQIDESVMSIAAIQHPEVTISKGLVNTYYLRVKGLMDSVAVRQISPPDSQ